MVIKHKDGTLYSALTGKAFEGPNSGAQLEPVPTLVSNWGDWIHRYPDTVAYEMFDKYQPKELPNADLEASRQTRTPADPRFAADEAVLGVSHGDRTRAYRLKDLAQTRLVRERVGDEQWVVLWNAATDTAAAYLSVGHAPDGKQPPRPLTLIVDRSDSNAPFVDQETKSHWDITGRAVDGELKGWTLPWLDGTQAKWFAWAAEYPTTSIYDAGE